MAGTDVEAVLLARSGDREAFDRVAVSVVDGLYRIARLVLRDTEAAEDAVQEALVRCWRDLPALRDPTRFDAWLNKLLMREIQDEFRAAGRRRATLTLLRLEAPARDG
jgi:RNA polymerase sigma factor (sigma-70 family)